MNLPTFGFVAVHKQPLAAGITREAAWLEQVAATGRAAAHLWQAPVGVVVPRRYTTLPGWPPAPSATCGDVQVRASGGGVVPQGPGVWNLSLAWPAPSVLPQNTDRVYRELCGGLSAALSRLGLHASPQAVDGSFCDGRYNLAVDGRKLVGTAQAWQRVAGVPLVLAHAVIVVSADPVELTARANDLEHALGTGVQYRPDALTSVAHEARPRLTPDALEARTIQVLAEQFARVLEPGTPHQPKE